MEAKLSINFNASKLKALLLKVDNVWQNSLSDKRFNVKRLNKQLGKTKKHGRRAPDLSNWLIEINWWVDDSLQFYGFFPTQNKCFSYIRWSPNPLSHFNETSEQQKWLSSCPNLEAFFIVKYEQKQREKSIWLMNSIMQHSSQYIGQA